MRSRRRSGFTFTKHKKLVEWHLSTQQVALNGSLLQSHYQHSVLSGYLNAENFKLKSSHDHDH